jgi:hypothetical protein
VDSQVQLEKENVTEVKRRWRNEFATAAPTRVTVVKTRDTVDADGTAQHVNKGRTGSARSSV